MEPSFASPLIWELVLVSLFAGIAHGVSGFGFPLISTPVVAMFTDVRSAVLLTLLPNILVNLISIIKGGNWRASLSKYWPVAVYVVIGTFLGTRLILIAPAEPLRLLLAAIIVVYLKQDDVKLLDWSIINRHPQAAGLAFGLLGGILSGAVNVALPPLIIYFSALNLAPLAMTQILNLCFLGGRVAQVTTFGSVGAYNAGIVLFVLPSVVAALCGVLIGGYFQSRIPAAAWRKLLRGILWTMAGVLLVQALRGWWRF